jgi:hypothetical protein
MGPAPVGGEAGPRVHLTELLQGEGSKRPSPVRRPVQHRIVQHYRNAIRREPHVELQRMGTHFDGQLKRGKGVLRSRP